MSTSYTTGQGETVDLVCLAFYGRTAGVVEAVYPANRGLAKLGPILPLGTIVVMPADVARPAARPLVALWE